MNPMNEPSMYSQPQSPGWPANAIPERWVEALFTAMSATYGARFADLWRGSKIEDVKRQWGVELAKLSSAQMRAGRESLTDIERAPTLPEFMAHCRRARIAAVESETPKLGYEPASTHETARAALQEIELAKRAMLRKEPNCDWAFRLLLNGKQLPYEVKRCASDAVTSPAGKAAVTNCDDPVLREEYRALRQKVVDDYRMRGRPLWSVA